MVAEIKVYDIVGRLVKNIRYEAKTAGGQKVTFNASDLSSGVYCYSLEVSGYRSVGKMLLMK